jgi:anti-sigma factor RsiW
MKTDDPSDRPGTGEPVPPDDLHAFVDGELAPERHADVIHWLARHPQDLARVIGWTQQRRALRALHRDLDPGPTPSALERTVCGGGSASPRSRPWAMAASVLVALGVGAVAGAIGLRSLGPSAEPTDTAGPRSGALELAGGAPPFVREASVAHAVFTPEKRHPVEVAGSDQQHLVQWLSRRLGQPLRAPDLQVQGYQLLGGRLLPGDPSPRAQFMYEDASGRRLTLFVTVFAEGASPEETSFRSARAGPRESFYWIEGRFGYALSAELPPADLQVLAREVYRQLDR